MNKFNLSFLKLKKETILICFLVGVLFLIVNLPTDRQKKSEVASEELDTEKEALQEYKYRVEKELKDILSKMEGVGAVDVMITVEDAGESVVEKDVRNNKEEKEEATVCVEDQDGKSPFVVKTLRPKIKGVFVVAEGGENPKIKTEIVEAVKALFQLESHKISIAKKK